MFTVLIGHEIGECQKDNGGGEKYPAVSGKPHGHGKASQAETGQDQRKLSTEYIGKRCGDGAAAGEFFFHFFSFNNLILLLPLPEACMVIFPSRVSLLTIKMTLSRSKFK